MFGRAVLSDKLKSTSAASIFLWLDVGKVQKKSACFLGRLQDASRVGFIKHLRGGGLDLRAPISLSSLIQPALPSYLQADAQQ